MAALAQRTRRLCGCGNPVRAASIVEEIRACCRRLREYPELGSAREDPPQEDLAREHLAREDPGVGIRILPMPPGWPWPIASGRKARKSLAFFTVSRAIRP
jgi:hypothetical protein